MKRRKLAIVLFCIVGPLFMSSCVKKTLETAATPVVAVMKGVGTLAKALFRTLRVKHGKKSNTTHTHEEKFCECPPLDDAPPVNPPTEKPLAKIKEVIKKIVKKS